MTQLISLRYLILLLGKQLQASLTGPWGPFPPLLFPLLRVSMYPCLSVPYPRPVVLKAVYMTGPSGGFFNRLIPGSQRIAAELEFSV